MYLEFPVDVLNAGVDRRSVREIRTTVNSHPVDLEKAENVLDMIETAERPVVIAGTGVWQSGADEDLRMFTENTCLPVFTSLSGRGCIPDLHPLCFEGALAIRPGAALSAYMATDLVILLGTRICLYYMFGEIFNRHAKLIQVDIEPEEIGRNRKIDLPVVSDVGALLKQCNKIILENGKKQGLRSRFAPWISSLEKAHQQGKNTAEKDWASEHVPIHPLRLAREINDFMDREDDIVVADGGDTTTWMGMTRTIRRPGHYLDYGIYGSLAVGLPYANAAKILYPEKRVCLITGDGSIGFNFMEFETAVRKKLSIVVVISNDLGWGMIRHSQEIRMGHAVKEGTHIGRVDYHKMVEALGGKAFLVVVFLHNALALNLGYWSGRLFKLEERDSRATCIEVGIQNSTLGLVLAFNFFGGLGGMTIVVAWWGIWHIIAGLMTALIFTRMRLPGQEQARPAQGLKGRT